MVQHRGTAPKPPHPRSGCLRLLPAEPRSRTTNTLLCAGKVGGAEGTTVPNSPRGLGSCVITRVAGAILEIPPQLRIIYQAGRGRPRHSAAWPAREGECTPERTAGLFVEQRVGPRMRSSSRSGVSEAAGGACD